MKTDEEAIRNILNQLEAAWNASDSEQFAEPFVEDANFIQIFGGQIDGRRAIEESHRQIFDTIYKGSEAAFALRSIRFIRSEVAIVFVGATVKFFEGREATEMNARSTFILAKEQGMWQIVAFQNTRISELPAAAQGTRSLTS